jgi:predicted peptidase
MMKTVYATLLASLLACIVNDSAQAQSSSMPTTPGIYELTLPQSGRRYTLSIPNGYTGQMPVPLIVSLHYGGTVTPFFGRGLLASVIEPALRELGAIVVAPDSAAGRWTNATAEQHILELVDHIEAHYSIDGDRTLLTGYSMGGGGTWYLAPRHPERFRAALIMAGRPQADSTDFDWTTPTYVIHSTADDIVPIESTRSTVEQLQGQGAPFEFVVLDGISHYSVPAYRPYVTAAIPWIERAWAR